MFWRVCGPVLPEQEPLQQRGAEVPEWRHLHRSLLPNSGPHLQGLSLFMFLFLRNMGRFHCFRIQAFWQVLIPDPYLDPVPVFFINKLEWSLLSRLIMSDLVKKNSVYFFLCLHE